LNTKAKRDIIWTQRQKEIIFEHKGKKRYYLNTKAKGDIFELKGKRVIICTQRQKEILFVHWGNGYMNTLTLYNWHEYDKSRYDMYVKANANIYEHKGNSG